MRTLRCKYYARRIQVSRYTFRSVLLHGIAVSSRGRWLAATISPYLRPYGRRYGGSSIQIPAADSELPVTVKSHGNHGAVGLEAHGVTPACGELDDARPAADRALPVAGVSHGDYGAVGLEAHGVSVACGDLGDSRPAADIALTGVVPSHGENGAEHV